MTIITPADPPSTPPPTVTPSRRRVDPFVSWTVAILFVSVVGTLLFSAGYLVGGAGGSRSNCVAPSEAFEAFCEAYERLKHDYVDPLDDEALAEGALGGLFDGVGDPYSAYMPPETYEQAREDLSGRFEGIGAEMAVKNLSDPEGECPQLSDTCVLVVIAPLADSPAEEAGIRAGDIVRSVDGEPVAGSSMQDQIERVRGPAGTDVTLVVERNGDELEFTITRAEIVIKEVQTRMVEPDVGYIQLRGFSDKSGEEFRAGLQELLDQGAQQIVFDLRNNPGGYIVAAQDVASEFIDEGVIFTQESHGDETREWTAQSGGVATDPAIPVVVLTNGGSASASEIVAAALQERGRATVIGEPTFGKNTVQVWAPLANNGGVRITISRWFTPDHNSVAPDGIQPDVVVEVPDDAPPEPDLILERAISFLETQATGDASSRAPSFAPATSAAAPSGVIGLAPAAVVSRYA
ncbi:MAG: S41 family peptidase [Chloroflexota bacterium]|nr:S41 family peptidase [Chloroflexota bacterium]